MAIRDKLAEQAKPHLQPGEQVQGAFAAMATSPYWSVLSYWIVIIKDANRAVVATDRRYLVFKTSRLRFTKFKSLESEAPRSVRLGEPSGLNYKTSALGQPLWIHKRFHKDVRALDATPAA